MSEVFRAVLSNAQHPEYGHVSMPFPIPNEEYDETFPDFIADGQRVHSRC